MERMLMEYLVNSIWQAPVLAGGAWLVLRAGKPGPRVQHGVWVAALALMVAMPLLSLRGVRVESAPVPSTVLPPVVAEVKAAQPTVDDSAVPVVSEDFANVTDEQPSPSLASLPSALQTSANAKESERWLRMGEVRLGSLATRWIVGLYLAAIGLAMMRLLWSWMVAWRMVAEATPAALSEGESALLETCCERLQVRRPRVLVSEKTSTPLVVGVLRPALLLPEKFAERSQEGVWKDSGREVEAVWLHELAHVRRRDYLANLMCRIWALPVAYHPVTHAVERRVRQTREMVCDRMAAEEMQSPVRYARCLVGLAQRMQDGRAMAEQMQGVGLFDGGVLEERVIELIGTKAVESIRMRVARAGCGVAMLAAVMGAAATFHVTPTMAQVAVPGNTLPIAAVEQPVMVAEVERTPEMRVSPVRNDIGYKQLSGAQQSVPNGSAQIDAPSGAAPGSGQSTHRGASYKVWLDQDVVWIITPEEREAFLRLTNDEERDLFIEQFWQRRNPASGSSQNSFKEEHYLRIAYANEHFAANTPGWKTDRGRAYIVNGKPDSVDSSPRGNQEEDGHPTEIWHYRSLQGSGSEKSMKFVDTCNCGEYWLQASKPVEPAEQHKTVAFAASPELLIAPKFSLQTKGPLVFSLQPMGKVWMGGGDVFPELSREQRRQLSDAYGELFRAERMMQDAQNSLLISNKFGLGGQFEAMQRQGKDAVDKMNSLEFKQRLADAQAAAAKLSEQKFKEQFEQMQRQVKDAMEKMNSPEFKEKLAAAEKQAQEDVKRLQSSPEFEQRLVEAQKQAKEAADKMSKSPEFQQRLAEAGRQAKEAMDNLDASEFRHKIAEAQNNSVQLSLPMLKQMPDGKWKVDMSPEAQKQFAEMKVARLKQQLDQAEKDLDRLNSGERKKTEAPKQPVESH